MATNDNTYGLTKESKSIFIEICKEIRIGGYTNLLHEFNEMFKGLNLNNKSILDIGCGNGLMSIYVSLKFPESRITSIDQNVLNDNNILHSVRKILIAKMNSNIQVKELDYWSNEQKYDSIIARHSIHHIAKPETLIEHNNHLIRATIEISNYHKYQSVFTKISKDLKPEGLLIFSDVIRNNIFNLMPRYMSMQFHNTDWDTKPYFWQWEQFCQTFKKHQISHLIPSKLSILEPIWQIGFQYIFPEIIGTCQKR